mgnify:CR=1 FL=1
MESIMERFERLVKESKLELKNIGINIDNDIVYEIDTRSKTRLGAFYRKQKKIKISEFMFNFNDTYIKNTIIHEMLHSLPRNR